MKLTEGTHPASPTRGQRVSHNGSFETAAAYGCQGQEDLDVSYLLPHISQQDRRGSCPPWTGHLFTKLAEHQ